MVALKTTLVIVIICTFALCSGKKDPPAVVQLTGVVDDCCCKAESVDFYNNGPIYELLTQLSKTEFFKYFKVNYLKPCSLWAESALCGMTEGGGCGVCECKDDEIPEPWRLEGRPLDVVDASLSPHFKASGDDSEDIWCDCDDSEEDMVYIDLLKNPERYTGYGGYNATRIWLVIYRENCFQDSECLEKRTLNRLVSGFHGSTTAHICEHYWQDGQYVPNVEMFAWKLGRFPEFIKNIYFTFLFLARAVSKARDQLLAFDYNTGKPHQDQLAQQLLKKLIDTELLCSPTFNESLMFSSSSDLSLREELRNRFRNISLIMDCVECSTCKIHAKLQMLGIGTALKILLPSRQDDTVLDLQRNEVTALINTFHKFSESVRIVSQMRNRRNAMVEDNRKKAAQQQGVSRSDGNWIPYYVVAIFAFALWIPLLRNQGK